MDTTRTEPLDDPWRADQVLIRRRIRVTMGDVDAARVIFFASPYRWHESLYSEWLAQLGHGLAENLRSQVSSPAVESGARYHAPLRLDDLVDLELVADKIGQRSYTLRTEAYRARDRVLALEVWIAHVWARVEDDHLVAVPLPDWLRAGLSGAAP